MKSVCPATDGRETVAVIVHDYPGSLSHARDSKIRAGESCGERIEFDSQQGSRRHTPPSRD